MTLTQTADRAALIEELALPADFEGMAESNAAPAMRIRNSCAKLEASPAFLLLLCPVKKSENIKLSRWPRNTGVFERGPVARKARATEQRSLARRGNAKPSRRPE